METIQNLEGMIQHAVQYPHLQSALTEKLIAHYQSTLESIDASTITTDDFNNSLILPIIAMKESVDANGKYLEQTLSDLAVYAPSIVYFFEKASDRSILQGDWGDMTAHQGMCRSMFIMLDALNSSDVEQVKRVISSHFNQYAKLDPTAYGYGRSLLDSFDDLMHDIHVHTSHPIEVEPHLIAELFTAADRVDSDVFANHTELVHHLNLYEIADSGYLAQNQTLYQNPDAVLEILKASISHNGNEVENDENFTHTLSNILKSASPEASNAFIDHLVKSTWNPVNTEMHVDANLLQTLLSYPNTPFSLSKEQSERIIGHIEEVMGTSQTYGYKDVSSDNQFEDLVRIFKSRVKFLNTFINHGSDPELDQRVLDLMNREHSIAFRDGLLDPVFQPMADTASAHQTDSYQQNWGVEQASKDYQQAKLEDSAANSVADSLNDVLKVIHVANCAVYSQSDIDNDPLSQTQSDKQQSLQ